VARDQLKPRQHRGKGTQSLRKTSGRRVETKHGERMERAKSEKKEKKTSTTSHDGKRSNTEWCQKGANDLREDQEGGGGRISRTGTNGKVQEKEKKGSLEKGEREQTGTLLTKGERQKKESGQNRKRTVKERTKTHRAEFSSAVLKIRDWGEGGVTRGAKSGNE